MRRLRKKVVKFVWLEFVSFIARLIYMAGLTLLIPLLPLVISPFDLFGARNTLFIAFGCIILSFAIVYYFSKSKKIALRQLGFATLAPGILAVVFSFLGPRRMALLYGSLHSDLLTLFLQEYVPKAWLLAGIYIIVGVGLISLAEKVRH